MVNSMTGYGRARQLLSGRDITVELRSVNNRYLDLNLKLPRIYSFAEEAVKSMIQGRISRGKLDVFITVDNNRDEKVRLSLNKPLLEGYLAVLSEISAEYGLKYDVSASSAAKFPDVLTAEKEDEDAEEVTRDITSVVSEALDAYAAMRKREGDALVRDVESHLAIIGGLVSRVEERSPVTVREYQQRLEAKLREILENRNFDEARIITETAIFADKVAVNEETVRLRSHLSQLDAMLTEGGPIGRKLDFLIQEVNREVNTIGSKGNDAIMAGIVVELKSEIEKIREQIQNIE